MHHTAIAVIRDVALPSGWNTPRALPCRPQTSAHVARRSEANFQANNFTYFGVLGHLSGALCKLSWAIFGECCESFGSVMEARSRNCAKMVQCGSESI